MFEYVSFDALLSEVAVIGPSYLLLHRFNFCYLLFHTVLVQLVHYIPELITEMITIHI